MKKNLFFIFLLIFSFSQAQLDREHWFAPMYDGQGNNGDYEQFLHLSTNDTTPFNVKIYNNNIVIAQQTISKGNPGVVPIDRDYIITRNSGEVLKVGTRGLYVKADKPCFANLRFGVTNHAEIITSKGTAGIGTKFYTVVAPNAQNSNNLGFAASFLATEDNTQVTVGNFKKILSFTNGANLSSITFNLNKGESYIIDGRTFNDDQKDGFIGATVSADKPISMSNGNFNGQYATRNVNAGSDILMDQSVPVDKLGNEFVVVKGYGAIGNGMENVVVVATEKNTAIYLNDSTVPFATLANEGDFYLINESNYIDRSNGHYNLHIKTDKNVYIYQLLGGVEYGSSPLATGGMNYIPPLNCYLPRKIDEISYINKISEYDLDDRFVTKLNIITEKGAVVKVNGVVPNALYGPYDISNISTNQTWVTYSIPDVTGNITVVSSKAVTAGIASGNRAFGYGGYFAGFSSIPLILKTEGDCLPGVKLEVTEGFDSYEWLIKVGANYIAAPGINNTFKYEPTQAGIYAVKLKQGTCPDIQTKDFKFYNCTTFTNYNYTTCTSQIISSGFALSSQSVNISTLKIDTPPTKGTVLINPDGTLTYTANPNATGMDTFKFTFCGNGSIPDCETVQATITLNQIEKYDVVLEECTLTGSATYDFRDAVVTPDPTIPRIYYQTLNGAENQIAAEVINNFANFTSTDRFVWVRMKNIFGCIAIAKIQLKSKLPAVVQPNLYNKTHCDEEIDGVLDGIYKVDVSTISPLVLQNPADHIIRYYDSILKANAGLDNNIVDIFSFAPNENIWIRVEPKNGCPPVVEKIVLKTGAKFIINTVATAQVCDDDLNVSEDINLDQYVDLFTLDSNSTVKYFANLSDAQNNKPTIGAAQTITEDRTFYYRFNKVGFCEVIGTLNFAFKSSTPTTLSNSYRVCEGESISLVAESSPIYKAWSWKQGNTILFTTEKATLKAGVYTVSFTNLSGCIFTKNITIVDFAKPQFNIALYNATKCDDDFDGQIKVKLSTVTPIILPNFSVFKVEYFSDSGLKNLLPNDWTYSANTTIFVRASSAFCPPEIKTIDFKIGSSLPLISNEVQKSVCDDNLDGIKEVNLSDYKSQFTLDNSVTATFFATLAEAQKNIGTPLDRVTVENSGIFYGRFQNGLACDSLGKLTITVKIPKESSTLVDQKICPGTKIELDAGLGFSKYLWSTGEKSQKITVPVGDYWVDLTYDGCTYQQNVKVSAVELPKITKIEIQENTITVSVSGGNTPYQYSIDGTNYQSSNIFTNVPTGDQTVYVISADRCTPITEQFTIIRILNVISPNNDGKNDQLDYSDLMKKEESFLEIFDRFGKIVFKGDKNNRFVWEGNNFGKPVNSGTYWYVIKWKEIGSETLKEYKGWVLVKNRE